MANVKVKTDWFGNQWAEKVRKQNADRLARIALLAVREIKQGLGVAVGKGKRPPAKARDTGGRFVAQVHFIIRSAPGEFPRKEYGELRRSITHTLDKQNLICRVGTPSIYGKYLELSTSKMAARPFIRPTLYRLQPRIKRILAGRS